MTKDYANGFRGRPSWLANNNTFHYSAWQVHGRSDFSSATPASTSRRITPCILIWSHHPSILEFLRNVVTSHYSSSLFAEHPLHVTQNWFAMKNYITSQHVGLRGRRKCLYPEEWWVDCKVSVFIIMLFRESWRQPRPGDDNRILPLLLLLSARSQSSSSLLSTVPGTVTSHTVTYDGIVILLLLVTCRPSKWNCSTHCEFLWFATRDRITFQFANFHPIQYWQTDCIHWWISPQVDLELI